MWIAYRLKVSAMSANSIIDDIIELRKEHGLTQQQLAKITNLAQPAIARMESKKAVPQLDTLLKITEALGYTIKLVPMK